VAPRLELGTVRCRIATADSGAVGSIRGQGNPVPREITTFSASRVSGRERVS
jgi:hypothetical protein